MYLNLQWMEHNITLIITSDLLNVNKKKLTNNIFPNILDTTVTVLKYEIKIYYNFSVFSFDY